MSERWVPVSLSTQFLFFSLTMSDRRASNRAKLVKPDVVKLYNAAFSEAVENLPSESKSFLLSTKLDFTFTAKDVEREVDEYCNKQLKESRLYRYAQKFKAIIEPLERFFVVIDQRVAGNLVPGIVWSCLRFIITVSILADSMSIALTAWNRLYATSHGISRRLAMPSKRSLKNYTSMMSMPLFCTRDQPASTR
jgi:hypothetical protein